MTVLSYDSIVTVYLYLRPFATVSPLAGLGAWLLSAEAATEEVLDPQHDIAGALGATRAFVKARRIVSHSAGRVGRRSSFGGPTIRRMWA